MPIWLFEFGQYIGAALLSLVTFLLMGLALLPAYCVVDYTYLNFGLAAALVSLPVAYLLWGTTFCLEVILAKRYVLFYKAREGQFPFISWNVIGWAVMGYVILIANTTFMQFFRGTPFMNMWLMGLGAKIGRRVNIQTTYITDWDMITIEDDVVLGGDCSLACHMLEKETLIFAPITVKKKALVGQAASLLPGVTVGEGALIGARSLMLKGTETEDRSIYAGVPGKLIRIREDKSSRA